MPLLSHSELEPHSTSYRLFEKGRDFGSWRIADIIRGREFTRDARKSELAWRLSSAGYYTEQAGLVTAARLAADTEDAVLRFSLATAVSDEARHADAFLAYAKAVGGEPIDRSEDIEPLNAMLESLPYLGKALVHTVLEGFAADQFQMLAEAFSDDPLGDLYRAVRADELRHIAIGLSYLSRTSYARESSELWRERSDEWLRLAADTVQLPTMCQTLATVLDRQPQELERWFRRRHHARLLAAGVLTSERR